MNCNSGPVNMNNFTVIIAAGKTETAKIIPVEVGIILPA